MSGISDYARIEFQVNGEQAKQKLKELEDRAFKLKNAIAEAALAGNKVELKKLRKDLVDTNKELRQMQSKVVEVENVMRRLDKATPNELNSALRTLKRELGDIERGSAAWDEHTRKIREVQEELRKVRVEQGLATERTPWQRFANFMQGVQATIVSVGAGFVALRQAMMGAVDAYADMDQEMANVRKYTGMTRHEVESLNEAFKGMDTRSSREELNRLAGEAGRLGKQSEEDILGYVRAADRINVALDELGEGATLTLSKLTGIFGDEERLGTEQALLSIGSAVNELAQNSRAGAGYLVEFGSRMGGVGAQAGITSSEVLGFGAVLDSYGQKVEASATALSQVITRIYREPAKYAKVAGLDVKEFTELVKTDMNGAIIRLMEALNGAGGMDVLSPMFKDMGENGARVIQTLSTLATHVDELKERQAMATKAFGEAVSVSREFNVQNNTVQADIDKAKKRFHEMAVELGEKLYPVMRYMISGTSALTRVIGIVIDFLKEYKGVIISVGASMLAARGILLLTTAAMKAKAAWAAILAVREKVLAAVTMTYYNVVALLSAGYYRLTGQAEKAAGAMAFVNKTMKANVFGVVVGLVIALVGGLAKLVGKLGEVGGKEKALQDIRKKGAESAQEEILRIDALRKAAMNEALAENERLEACKRLNEINPKFCAEIDRTTGKYREAKNAVNDYIKQLIRQYEIEAAEDKLKEIAKQRLEAQQEMKKAYDSWADVPSWLRSASDLVSPDGLGASDIADIYRRSAVKKLKELDEQRDAILKEFGNDIQRKAVANAPSSPDLGGGGGGGYAGAPDDDKSGSGGGGKEDKFKAEKEWKEREEALNLIAYARGERNLRDYTKRSEDIMVEYYRKMLGHADLEGNERVTLEAKLQDTLMKIKEAGRKRSADEEEADYNEVMAREKQRYVDGEVDQKTYNSTMEMLEEMHWLNLMAIYEEGSGEYEKAKAKYDDIAFKNAQKRNKEAEDAEKKHQEELKKLKDSYFGRNAKENSEQYAAARKNLDEVYKGELAAAGDNAKEKLRIDRAYQEAKVALAKMYNQEIEDDTRSGYRKTIEGIAEWLESDGGKILTKSLEVLADISGEMTSIVQAELEIQEAAIEKRYEKEISAAEGNNYKVKQLEKQKEKELAKAKKEANRKAFVMQVMQAVATTAQGAINAYTSAAQAPFPLGITLPPIAAAMALAAGAIQIAAIKKQQQASEASGYAKGGFTPAGRVDEPVGVVHAGEWVASQKLLASPGARAIINTLDYAQKTNTIGRLDADDVSMSITAPSVIAQNTTSGQVAQSMEAQALAFAAYAETMRRLQERLEQPFVTVNTVTGDAGIKKAQDDYDKLMKNKSPKR